MPRYCLDANVLIEAKDGPYGFDIVPGFWDWLDRMGAQASVYSVAAVLDELSQGNDALSDWARVRRGSGFFVDPLPPVQKELQLISDYVVRSFEPQQAQTFLAGADPWVIAQAKADSSVVVTHEVLVPASSKKVKIPNVCGHFSVLYVDTYTMLRQMGASFS